MVIKSFLSGGEALENCQSANSFTAAYGGLREKPQAGSGAEPWDQTRSANLHVKN